MKLTRKDFLTHGALASAALALTGKTAAAAETAPAPAAKPPPGPPPPSAIHFPVLKSGQYHEKEMWAALKTKKAHKLVWESVSPHLIVPGLASLYIHVQNALNAGEFSFGWGKQNVASAAVLLGPSIILAFNDSIWSKYKFGDSYKMLDAAGKPETANVYYKAQTSMSFDGDPGAGGNIYQDWSGEACVKRGTTFMVCHNALTAFGALTAMGMGMDPGAVIAEWKANMLPGFIIVPAGVGALHAAMDNGWKMLPII
ncbi:MAG TPA: hypothetical protein VLW85_23840 [Myxococcales bacterium]|nr:hypothetical protein [Myxococcales bacterium]